MEPPDSRSIAIPVTLNDGRTLYAQVRGARGGRTVLYLSSEPPPVALAHEATSHWIVAPELPTDTPRGEGAATAAWAFDAEHLADQLELDTFLVLAEHVAADLAAAIAFVLPHRVEAVGLLRPSTPDPGLPYDLGALTVPVVIWADSADQALPWTAVPGSRVEREPGGYGEVLAALDRLVGGR